MKSLVVALAESLDKSFPWAVGFFFGNTELSMELWTVIAGVSGFDDKTTPTLVTKIVSALNSVSDLEEHHAIRTNY